MAAGQIIIEKSDVNTRSIQHRALRLAKIVRIPPGNVWISRVLCDMGCFLGDHSLLFCLPGRVPQLYPPNHSFETQHNLPPVRHTPLHYSLYRDPSGL